MGSEVADLRSLEGFKLYHISILTNHTFTYGTSTVFLVLMVVYLAGTITVSFWHLSYHHELATLPHLAEVPERRAQSESPPPTRRIGLHSRRNSVDDGHRVKHIKTQREIRKREVLPMQHGVPFNWSVGSQDEP